MPDLIIQEAAIFYIAEYLNLVPVSRDVPRPMMPFLFTVEFQEIFFVNTYARER